MSDGSDYCKTDIINTLTSEPSGVLFVRERLYDLLKNNWNRIPSDRKQQLRYDRYLTTAMNTEDGSSIDIYNFNYDDMVNILASYNIPQNFLWMIHRRQLNDANPPPVILLNVSLANINDMNIRRGNHWVVLYRRADFRDDCPYLTGIGFLSDNRIPAMRRKYPESISLTPKPAGYRIYYPRYEGDCGPDAIRITMLLYCCWLLRQGATLTRSSSQKDSPPRAKKTGSPEAISEEPIVSPLTPFSPEKKPLADDANVIFTSINQPHDISQGLQDAALRVANEISSTLSLADANDENINEIAESLVNNTRGISSGDSTGSQFSQELLGIAQKFNILPPPQKYRRGAEGYNSRIQEILHKLGTDHIKLRDVYTATKGAKAIDETKQFQDVWGKGIAEHIKRDGFCYLSGQRFSDTDSPEMDHVKFATSAFMECIHYRDLQNNKLCGIEVSKLWQDFISTQSGIDLLWNLYQTLNLGTIKKGLRVYNERAVNACYEKVFSAFYADILIKCREDNVDIDEDIFIYSTRMLKFWLAEFAYALHIFNQAKGGLSFNNPRGITAMYKNVERRVNNRDNDPKTFIEWTNHPEGLLKKDDFIANRVKHLEQIVADFNKGYGCVSNLRSDQVANQELVSVIILMKQIRNILLYSRIQNGPRISSATLDRDIAASIITQPNEAENLNNQLIELQSKIQKLQYELTTKTTTMVTKRMLQIQYEITEIQDEIAKIQNKINEITPRIVPENLQEDLINSQQAIEDLINSQQETRGLAAPRATEDDSIRTRPITMTANPDGYATPPPTSPENYIPGYIPGPPADSDEEEWEMMPESNGGSNKKGGGTIKNKRITKKLFASRPRKYTQPRKITKRLMYRRKRYTRKQKK